MQFVHPMLAISTHPGQINYFQRSVVNILGIKTVKKNSSPMLIPSPPL